MSRVFPNPMEKKNRPSWRNWPEVDMAASNSLGLISEIELIPRNILNFPLGIFLQHSRIGYLLTDEKNRIVWVNPIFESEHRKIFPKLEVIGMNFYEALESFSSIISDFSQVSTTILEIVREWKEKFDLHFSLYNGKEIVIGFYPLTDANLQKIGEVWSFYYGIKQHPAIEESKGNKERFRIIVESLNVGFCELDPNGIIMKVYDGFCDLTGFSRKELLGMDIHSLLNSREAIHDVSRNRKEKVLNSDNPVLYEMELITKEGNRKWTLASSKNLVSPGGDIFGVIEAHMDITPQKMLQEELEKSKKDTEESNVSLQQFLASMSHEIRTPLNAIIGMSHLLSDTKLTRVQKEYVHILKNSSNILLNLISDILDFSKIQSGKMEIQVRKFDLHDLVRTLTDTFRYKVKRKPVELIFIPDPNIKNYLIGDDILLNQVLLNLLGNAEKFTNQGSIEVSTNLIRREGDEIWVEFKVRDSGIGIERDKLQVIFQEFKQAYKGISHTYGGTGLGLSISKKLIELQGGNIQVESTIGQGSCFSFTLPFHDTSSLVEGNKIEEYNRIVGVSQGFNDSHVLIVEDNPMNLSYLTSLLQKLNIQFEVATNGFDALELTRNQPFHLVLMDIKIPGIEGLEVSKIIRNEENPNAATPIVLITAAALQSTITQARESGINDLLTKPYTPDQLLRILRKYLVDEDQDDTGDKFIETEPRVFVFNPRLDVNYLSALYEHNIEYATGLFEIFLENIHNEWDEIKNSSKVKNFILLRQLVHKIKPNFSMVGLTWITSEMEMIEKCLKEDFNFECINNYIQKADRELELYLPVIQDEYQKLIEFEGLPKNADS